MSGWLPQEVMLFEGTVAENIARLDPDPDPEAVVRAAERVGAHDMIVGLPGGYDFEVAAGGTALSGGQRQRIALARALYRDPVVLILDEPDAHLDAAGAEALSGTIADLKARGGSAVVIAHRPGIFAQCDLILLMAHGRAHPAEAAHREAPGLEPPRRAIPVRKSKPPERWRTPGREPLDGTDDGEGDGKP